MCQRFCLFALFALFLLPAATPAAESEGVKIAKALSNAYAEIAERVTPSVVAIEVNRELTEEEELDQIPFALPPEMKKYFRQKMRQQRPRNQPQGMGSGIIVDENGTILTNNHVVQDATRIRISLFDGVTYDGEVVGTDPKSDVAIIKISKPDRKFPTAAIGDSDQVKVGNIVLAIGAPFGLKESVTSGIVSAINRNRVGQGGGELGSVMYKNFIQTDATINPGNSGGPLVDLDGAVIGINSAISTAAGGSDGVGFAIPANMAKEIMKELIASGSVTRGWLGVAIGDFTPEMAAALPAAGIKTGVLVLQIFPDTPAAKGGLKFGDIMLSYNGTSLTDATHLQNLVAKTPVDDIAKIEVLRGTERLTLNVPIGRQPKKLSASKGSEDEEEKQERTPASVYKSELLGVEVVPLERADKTEQEAYKGLNGLVVLNVAPESPADDAGVPKGALLMLVNLKSVATVADLKAAEASLQGKPSALLHFQIGDRPAVVTLELTPRLKKSTKENEGK